MPYEQYLNTVERFIVEQTVQMVTFQLETLMSKRTAKQWATNLCKPHQQSTKRIAGTAVLYNAVSGAQKLPARRGNIKMKLPGDLSEVHRTKLSEILRECVQLGLFENITNNKPLPRGRPKGLGFEDNDRGGVPSFYEMSIGLAEVQEILKKPEVRRAINNALLESGILPKYLRFRNLVLYHLVRIDENAFWRQVQPFPFVRDMVDTMPKAYELFLNKIKSLSEGELENEAAKVAEATLNKNIDNVNFFINVTAGALALDNVLDYFPL